MFARLSKVAKLGLASEKKITRNSSVAKGAMLRSWSRSQAAARARKSGRAISVAGAVIPISRSSRAGRSGVAILGRPGWALHVSRGGQQAIFADRLPRELMRDH